jgi:hypothetical protein
MKGSCWSPLAKCQTLEIKLAMLTSLNFLDWKRSTDLVCAVSFVFSTVAYKLLAGKPSQVIMVKNGNNVEAYQFDAAAQQWQKVGDVVDAIGQKRNQTYNGQTYDYVFDVDIGDGQTLKLPYNATGTSSSRNNEFPGK